LPRQSANSCLFAAVACRVSLQKEMRKNNPTLSLILRSSPAIKGDVLINRHSFFHRVGLL